MSNATMSKPRLKTSAMIASIAGEGQLTRSAPFGHALAELARQKSYVVGMTADLGKYTDLHIFAKEFPERYYQMGMAEQLLMGAAAGLAHEGGKEDRHDGERVDRRDAGRPEAGPPPYQAGVDLAHQMGASLITFDGTQHTVVFNGDECVDTSVVNYLVDSVVPPDGLRC